MNTVLWSCTKRMQYVFDVCIRVSFAIVCSISYAEILDIKGTIVRLFEEYLFSLEYFSVARFFFPSDQQRRYFFFQSKSSAIIIFWEFILDRIFFTSFGRTGHTSKDILQNVYHRAVYCQD